MALQLHELLGNLQFVQNTRIKSIYSIYFYICNNMIVHHIYKDSAIGHLRYIASASLRCTAAHEPWVVVTGDAAGRLVITVCVCHVSRIVDVEIQSNCLGPSCGVQLGRWWLLVSTIDVKSSILRLLLAK